MALTIEQGFKDFISLLKPGGAETTLAASHRATIVGTLRARHGMTHFFRSGSFGHHTSVRGYSDVDFFAVFPPANLSKDSSYTLQQIRGSLINRLPRTEIVVRSPAVHVPFGTYASESHEIVPAWHIENWNGHRVFGIPDRAGGWMKSAPEAYNAWVNANDTRLGEKLKPLICLMKAWAYMNDTGLRSFWVEMRVTEWAMSETAIIYSMDIMSALRHIVNNLVSMPDPYGIGDAIAPCNPGRFDEAKRKATRDLEIAVAARDYEQSSNIRSAFEQWKSFFNGRFASYG